MKEKYLIGRGEAACLMINLAIYKVFTGGPKAFLSAGPSAFLSALIAGIIAYGAIWCLTGIYKKTGKKSIFELLENHRILLIFLGIIIIIRLVLSAAYGTESFAAFSKLSAFPASPFAFVGIFFLFGAAAAVIRGIEAAVRPHTVIVPFYILIILIMLLAATKSFEYTNLLPVLGRGAEETLFAALWNLSYFFDFVLVFLINPFMAAEKNCCRTLRVSGAAGIIINLLIILSVNLTIPYQAADYIDFPVFQVMKNVYFGRVFQRIDGIYLLAASLSAMAYLSFSVFLMTYTFKKIFRLEANRAFAFLFSFMVLLIAMLINKNIFERISLYVMAFEAAAALIIALVPVFSFIGRSEK